MELENVQHLDSVTLRDGDALIVVDMQNDFMPGGALPVEEGDTFIDQVNHLMQQFEHQNLPVVFTQDWHTADHKSFASAHSGKGPFEAHEEPGIGPVLWPNHCVQGTEGAAFHPDLDPRYAETIIRKGYRSWIDRAIRAFWRMTTKPRPDWTAISKAEMLSAFSSAGLLPIIVSILLQQMPQKRDTPYTISAI